MAVFPRAAGRVAGGRQPGRPGPDGLGQALRPPCPPPRAGKRCCFWPRCWAARRGAGAGMYLFRHKTRHWYFAAGMPLILACQVALAVWLCR